jgi:hypothetical protein
MAEDCGWYFCGPLVPNRASAMLHRVLISQCKSYDAQCLEHLKYYKTYLILCYKKFHV